ncbi:hypothetical protein ASD42_01460 [Nocardia sp. Root136]|nr:hypothetical protein ASD42_01460 [Nocardia sp. Root136]
MEFSKAAWNQCRFMRIVEKRRFAKEFGAEHCWALMGIPAVTKWSGSDAPTRAITRCFRALRIQATNASMR